MGADESVSRFEWDETKREKNLQKHGIAFEDAIFVFEGPVLVSSSPSGGEERMIALGPLGGVFIAVIFTMRGEVRRIISARRARRGEIRKHHAHFAL